MLQRLPVGPLRWLPKTPMRTTTVLR